MIKFVNLPNKTADGLSEQVNHLVIYRNINTGMVN